MSEESQGSKEKQRNGIGAEGGSERGTQEERKKNVDERKSGKGKGRKRDW